MIKYMSPADAAKRYGISRTTMYQIMNMPESPSTIKIGRSRLIPVEEYDTFIENFFVNEEKRGHKND